MTDSQMHAYARLGAQTRRMELLNELSDLDAFLALTEPVVDTGTAILEQHVPRRMKTHTAPAAVAHDETPRKKRRKMSAEARAKIGAAQRARWAKQKNGR